MSICDKDCFRCPWPDCINDTMDAEDYAEARGRDKLLQCPTGQGRRPDRSVEAQRREQLDRKNACNRAWYAKNREAILAKAKARRESDPEYAARQKAYYQEHREELRARYQAYYAANRDKVVAANRAYNASHRTERLTANQAYREAHREEINAKARERYRAHAAEINAKARERYRAKQEASRDM